MVPSRANGRQWHPKCVAYVQSTLEFFFGCCGCRKPHFPQVGCWKWLQGLRWCFGDLRVFCRDFHPQHRQSCCLIILLRPPSFATSVSKSSCTDMLDSPGLSTNGPGTHSLAGLWAFCGWEVACGLNFSDRDVTERIQSFFKIKHHSDPDSK